MSRDEITEAMLNDHAFVEKLKSLSPADKREAERKRDQLRDLAEELIKLDAFRAEAQGRTSLSAVECNQLAASHRLHEQLLAEQKALRAECEKLPSTSATRAQRANHRKVEAARSKS
jgi:hypothetical protein